MTLENIVQRNILGELLQPLAFEECSKLFALDHGALGFGFVCAPLAGIDEKSGDRLNVLLNQDWPVDTALQFSLYAGPDLERDFFEILEEGKVNTGYLGRSRMERVNYLRMKTQEPFDIASQTCARNFKLIITCRIPHSGSFPSERDMERAESLQQSVKAALRTVGIYSQELDPVSYVRLMQTILNQGQKASWRSELLPQYDQTALIRDQVLDYDTALQVDSNGLSIGDIRIKTLSVKRFPAHAYLGIARRFITEPMTGTRGIRENCLITASLIFPDNESRRGKLEKDRQFNMQQAYGPMLKFVPRLADKKESFDALFEALDNGDRCVSLYLGVVLFTDRESEDAAVSNARTFFRESGYQIMPDTYISLPLLLTCLPFGAEPKLAKDLMRFKTMSTTQAATQLPIFGSWQGTGTHRLTFVARDGQLVSFNLFDSGSNYNGVIAAQSGSGKSFLTNEISLSYQSAGAICRIIDVGRSYEKICNRLDGIFIAFTPDSNICINPFDIVADYSEEEDILIAILATMAAPNEGLSDFQTAGLRRVLSETWESLGHSTRVDDVAALLIEEPDQRMKDIGLQLHPFTTKGEYGRYFSGKNNIDFKNPFCVVELEELKMKPHLQKVVLLQIIYNIQQEMYLGPRDLEKIVIVDEAWDLLNNGTKEVVNFIIAMYRRLRKYNGSVVIITQSLHDLGQTPGGRAILENSISKILLGQKAETISSLQKEGILDLGEFEFEVLKTLKTVPGKYSELYIQTEFGHGPVRLYVEPYKRLLYSTKAADVHAIDQLIGSGMNIDTAICTILKDRGEIVTDLGENRNSERRYRRRFRLLDVFNNPMKVLIKVIKTNEFVKSGIENISSSGLKVVVDDHVSIPGDAEIEIVNVEHESLNILVGMKGLVKWTHNEEAGIEFYDEIDLVAFDKLKSHFLMEEA